MASNDWSNDPFYMAKRQLQEQVNKLQQDYARTLATMDRSVDKAESEPDRYGVPAQELSKRRQWIQDTTAHVRQVQSALENVNEDFIAVAVPGNADLRREVQSAQEQEQLTVAKQDEALDRIEEAAARVADLGLAINHELKEQEGLLEHVDRDTEGVMGRISASTHKLHEVLKKMNFWGQLVIIIVLIVILMLLLMYTFN